MREIPEDAKLMANEEIAFGGEELFHFPVYYNFRLLEKSTEEVRRK